MGVTGLPRWAIAIKPGDVLRSNATYDTRIQATYENMGISVALFAPTDAQGRPTAKGLDPFKARRDTSFECQSGFSTSRNVGLARGLLCDKGVPTHGHLPESGNFGGPNGTLPTKAGPAITDIPIAGFTYLQSDFGQLSSTGIPTVKMGQSLRFLNLDAAADVYHTITACGFPCTGPTGTSFPVANGRSSLGKSFDWDSAELGVGPPYIGPAKNAVDWSVPVTAENGFQPGAIVTYYCRIHPFMRGAVQVQK
jgi:plastocyanin